MALCSSENLRPPDVPRYVPPIFRNISVTRPLSTHHLSCRFSNLGRLLTHPRTSTIRNIAAAWHGGSILEVCDANMDGETDSVRGRVSFPESCLPWNMDMDKACCAHQPVSFGAGRSSHNVPESHSLKQPPEMLGCTNTTHTFDTSGSIAT